MLQLALLLADSTNELLSKVYSLLEAWVAFYLNNPEFSEKLDSTLTRDQLKLFVEISKKTYQCFALNLGDEAALQTDVENFMKNYDMKEIDDLIDKVDDAIHDKDHDRIVILIYERIFQFYIQLVQKTDRGLKVLGEFTEEEKNFMETLVAKRNGWFFHAANIEALADYAKFWKGWEESKILQSVCEKLEIIEKNQNAADSKPDDEDSTQLTV